MTDRYLDFLIGEEVTVWVLCYQVGDDKPVPVGSRFYRTRAEARKATREFDTGAERPFPVKLTNA